VKARPSKTEKRPPSQGTPYPMRLHDTQTGMLLGMPRSARGVQRFDDSLNSAIHITFRAFAAFFIDAKAKRSVVESCVSKTFPPFRRGVLKIHTRDKGVSLTGGLSRVPPKCTEVWVRENLPPSNRTGNDPSAGSPTETLLRLLLPLNDQV
jgi:hypothetical protein